MTKRKSDCDALLVIASLLVFSLPLTLLIPGFSIWDVIPKIRVTRCHAFSYITTWSHLNGSMFSAMTVLFCLFLEIRKRRLEDIMVNVMNATESSDNTLFMERDRQAATLRACVQLLDASAEHYENLVLLRDDLKRRDLNQPPTTKISNYQP